MTLPRLLGLIFGIVGLGVFGSGSWNLWLAHDSARWPVVPGRVNNVAVKQTPGRAGSTFRIVVTYQYEVNGQYYVSDRVFFGDNVSVAWSPTLRAERDRYHRGRTVDVHYDPRTPSRAVLEPGFEWRAGLVPLMGFVTLAAGAFMLVVRPRPRTAGRAAPDNLRSGG